MKMYLLLSITEWSFAGGYQNKPRYNLVESPQDAAIKVHQLERSRPGMGTCDVDQNKYKLFELVFDKGEVSITDAVLPKLSIR